MSDVVNRHARTRWWREWPVILVEAALVVSLAVIAVGGIAAGGVLLGCTALLAGVLRMVLTVRGAGLLAVRSRLFDVLMLFTVGGAIIVLSQIVTPR